MAIITEQPADIGPGTVSYFRLSGWTKYPDPVPNHVGSRGRVVAHLSGYDSEEDRRTGVSARVTRSVQMLYGAECADRPVAKEIPKAALAIWGQDKNGHPKLVGYSEPPEIPASVVMLTDQPVDADIYAAIKKMPGYEGATDT